MTLARRPRAAGRHFPEGQSTAVGSRRCVTRAGCPPSRKPGFTVVASRPGEFAARIPREIAQGREVVAKAGIAAE